MKSLGTVDLTKPSLSAKGFGMLVIAVAMIGAAYVVGRYVLGLGTSAIKNVVPSASSVFEAEAELGL